MAILLQASHTEVLILGAHRSRSGFRHEDVDALEVLTLAAACWWAGVQENG